MLARHRRPLTMLLLLTAVWVTIRSALPPSDRVVSVAVADHDLAAGSILTDSDLRTVRWPQPLAPPGRVVPEHAPGQTLATAVGAGEAITTPRLLGPGLLAGQPASVVAITLRVADPASLAPIQAGDRIDVLAADIGSLPGSSPAAESGPAQAAARRVAANVLVLAKPSVEGSTDAGDGWAAGAFGAASPGTTASATTGVVVLAVDPQTAARLAGASSAQPLTVVLLSQN